MMKIGNKIIASALVDRGSDAPLFSGHILPTNLVLNKMKSTARIQKKKIISTSPDMFPCDHVYKILDHPTKFITGSTYPMRVA